MTAKTASTPPTTPTAAELERAAVHEAKALMAGKDECRCTTCRKVARALVETLT